MDQNDLFEGIGELDEELLERSERTGGSPKRRRWIRWGTLAACLCLLVGGGLLGLSHREERDDPMVPVEPAVTPDNSVNLPAKDFSTSERYETLADLLAYLSTNDFHASVMGTDGVGDSADTSSEAVIEGTSAIAYGGYSYHIGGDGVIVSKLGGTQSTTHLDSDVAADQLFLCGERLIVVQSFASGGNELEPEWSAAAQIYSLSEPEKPILLEEFVQRGSLSACYMNEGDLYLMTSDGVCACGWSRLDDISGYVPHLTVNGEAKEWGEENICILGGPTQVQYLAVAKINLEHGVMEDRQAFYGDIDQVHYGPGWIAVTTKSQTETRMTHPEVYTFDTTEKTVYTGKINLADMFELGGEVRIKDGKLPEGDYPAVLSVDRANNVYRVVGVMHGSTAKKSLLAVAANMETAEYNFELLDTVGGLVFEVSDLVWESERAVVSISETKITDNDVRIEDRFLFVEFDGMQIALFESSLTVDHVSGVDMMYSYGSPFGELKTLIPMGDDIYLRFNEAPNGLDIFDFSDSSAPACLYKAGGDLPEGHRFEFIWKVYSENTFGILQLRPDEQGDYRNAAYSWCIYSVDPAAVEPYTMLAQYDVGECEGYGAESLGFSSFSYEGKQYCVTKAYSSAILLEW